MADLVLSVKREYFEQIKRGDKTEEYRLGNDYWLKRLHERPANRQRRKFDRVIITLGYPKADDESRRLAFPWRGFMVKTITHPHFGPDPVHVYAIQLKPAHQGEGRE